jgi:hypothetical protein
MVNAGSTRHDVADFAFVVPEEISGGAGDLLRQSAENIRNRLRSMRPASECVVGTRAAVMFS